MIRTLNPDVPSDSTPGGRCPNRSGPSPSRHGRRTYQRWVDGDLVRFHSDDQTVCEHGYAPNHAAGDYPPPARP